MIIITSDLPVLVGQYMKSAAECDTIGDSSLMLVPQIEAFYNNVTFTVLKNKKGEHYFINTITTCNQTAGLLFDDTKPMTGAGWDVLSTDDQTMCVVRGEVTTGLHSVSSIDPSARLSVSVYQIGRSTQSQTYRAAIAFSGTYVYYSFME